MPKALPFLLIGAVLVAAALPPRAAQTGHGQRGFHFSLAIGGLVSIQVGLGG